MIANYHTHTSRCRHAVGSDEAYVQAAIDSGLQILGFSDHTPYWFDSDYYSRFRMYPEQLQDYVHSVDALRRDYGDKLSIHLGLETEFYPKYFPELVCRLRDTPVEYMILGQHYVGNEIGDWYSGAATADPDILRRYCRQVCQGLETGLFSCLAHPGLIHYKGPDRDFYNHMAPVVRAAKDCGAPLELNFLGLREGRNYPDLRVWELAAQEDCPVVFGIDAHAPEHFDRPDILDQAKSLAANYGLRVLPTLDLRSL